MEPIYPVPPKKVQPYCSTNGCVNRAHEGSIKCSTCIVAGAKPVVTQQVTEEDFNRELAKMEELMPGGTVQIKPGVEIVGRREGDSSLADKYPKYHKRIPQDWTTLDVYGVCSLFPVDDPSGCLNHARKKLLVPGTRTGGKSFYKDVMEARDTLNRWLELNIPATDVQ